MNVEEELVKLNWNQNDAKIFVALVELGVSTPQILSKNTGIDRTRVYDSLKRLIKKGYVAKEQKEWGGKYQAEPVEEVFSKEIEQIKHELEIANELREQLKERAKKKEEEQRLVWAIQGKKNVRTEIMNFITNAKERVYWLMSPDLFGPPMQGWAFDALVAMKKAIKSAKIQVSLQLNDENLEQVRKLLEQGIEVYTRDEPLLPLALLIVDSDKFIQLSISNFEALPEYTFGIYGKDVSEKQIQGMEYLFYHLLKDHTKISLESLTTSE
jgi:sugar-specific transcriptional regulator TrmB